MNDKDSTKIIQEKWKTKYTDEKIMKLAEALKDNEKARNKRNAELNEQNMVYWTNKEKLAAIMRAERPPEDDPE